MNNYSNFCRDVKRDLLEFLNEVLFKNIKPLPDKKLILDLVYGVLRSGSLHLSNIVRALKESISPINVERRLSVALQRIDLTKYEDKLIKYNLFNLCTSNPLKIIMDESDVIKPYGFMFENLTYIHDGSKPNRPKEKGFRVSGCIGIGSRNSIIPISLKIYSTIDKSFVSVNDHTINIINKIHSLANEPITVILDRGYDSSVLINNLSFKSINYVIRAKNARKYDNFTIDRLFSKMKGLYSNNYVNKENKPVFVKFNSKIFTHSKINKSFYLVYEKRDDEKDYRVYLTNKVCFTKEQCEEVIKSYRLRWRIEELFRFIKEEFGFEKYRVRSLKAMNNLCFILSIAVSYLTYIYLCNNHIFQSCLKCYMNLKNEKKEQEIGLKYGYYGIKLYQLKRGLQDILVHIKDKPTIKKKSKKEERYEQLRLF